MSVFRLTTTFNKLCLQSRPILANTVLNFWTSPCLMAEPLKKKKRIDPAVLRAREDRKKRRLEKQIRRLEKNARQLKPIDECEIPLQILDQRQQRERQLPAFSSELLEKRALLVKRWTNYKREQHLADLKDIDRIVFAQQKALDQLRRESEELYQQAIQIDAQLIPYKSEGPVETPPIENYEVPDGEYEDVSRKWE